MPDNEKIRVSLLPGAETPEGAERLRKEMTARDAIDFRAFQMLRRLHGEGFVNLDGLRKFFEEDGETEADAKEAAKDVMDEIDQIIRDRIMADHRVLAAAAGRPE